MRFHLNKIALFLAVAAVPVSISGTLARSLPFKPISSAFVAMADEGPGDGSSVSFTEALHSQLELAKAGLGMEPLELALKGFERLSESGAIGRDSILAIADFGKSSGEKRLFVIDLKKRKLVYKTYVAHGRNSGGEYANRFSNKPSSNMSSLGFFVTKGTYMGSNGYSLVLDGCEKGINDKARDRAIVMHAADYANEEVVKGRGYLGRSFGCPALPEKMNRKIIDRIKGGNVLFIYHPGSGYLQDSKLINS